MTPPADGSRFPQQFRLRKSTMTDEFVFIPDAVIEPFFLFFIKASFLAVCRRDPFNSSGKRAAISFCEANLRTREYIGMKGGM